MNKLEAPQNWSESEGQIVPPEVDPVTSKNQGHINRYIFRHDPEFDFHHAAVVAAELAETPDPNPTTHQEHTIANPNLPGRETKEFQVMNRVTAQEGIKNARAALTRAQKHR